MPWINQAFKIRQPRQRCQVADLRPADVQPCKTKKSQVCKRCKIADLRAGDQEFKTESVLPEGVRSLTCVPRITTIETSQASKRSRVADLRAADTQVT